MIQQQLRSCNHPVKRPNINEFYQHRHVRWASVYWNKWRITEDLDNYLGGTPKSILNRSDNTSATVTFWKRYDKYEAKQSRTFQTHQILCIDGFGEFEGQLYERRRWGPGPSCSNVKYTKNPRVRTWKLRTCIVRLKFAICTPHKQEPV